MNDRKRIIFFLVVNEDLISQNQASLDHPWFADDMPQYF
jgi:hypothetical protein